MNEKAENFTTNDKPLSASQAEDIGKIRVKDVKEAINTADADVLYSIDILIMLV